MKLNIAGFEVLLDDADWHLVEGHSWNLWFTKTKVYALASAGFMHRLLLGATKGQVVHHLNGDGLDNRRKNLHLGTQQENLVAIGPQPRNTSGYKGVRHTGRNLVKPWIARYKYCGKTIHIGYFSTAEQAAKAYDEAVKNEFGSTAYLNFPEVYKNES